MRLFLAVPLPQAVRAALCAAAERLALAFPSLGAVRSEALHVTLRFLGETSPSDAQELRTRMQRAKLSTRAFRATMGGYGQFPPGGQPRVLYVGFRSGAEALVDLWKETCAVSQGIGEEPPESSFVPHVTLARNRRGAVSRTLPPFAEFAAYLDGLSLEVPVAGAVLYESQLGSGGPRYTPLEEVTCAP